MFSLDSGYVRFIYLFLSNPFYFISPQSYLFSVFTYLFKPGFQVIQLVETPIWFEVILEC